MAFFESEVDKLLKIEEPILKYERFFSLLYIYIDGQHSDVVINLLKEFIEEAENKNIEGYDAVFYCSLGYIYLSLGKKELFHECFQIAQNKLPTIKTASGLAIFYTYQSIVSWFDGKRNDGFDYIFKSIRAVENTPFDEVNGWCYYTLATYQFDSNQLLEAEENYNKSLEYFKKSVTKYGYARTSNGLASIKIKQGKLQEAAEILNEIREIYVYYGKLSGLSRALTDLGVIESKLGRHRESLTLHEHAYQMRLDTSNIQGQITSLLEMGQELIALKKYKEGEQKLTEAVTITEKNNFKAKAFRAHQLLAQLHKEQKNWPLAMQHLEQYFNLKSQVLVDESTGRLKLLQTQLLAEESEKRAELEQQNNLELRKAYTIIESKNSEILQSIDYAKRIQKTILPGKKTLTHYFPHYFVFYQPKDIVAGDFYWFKAIDSKLFFAVCDSTGHGVPGAFVSLVCNQALNRAVTEFNLLQPSLILDKVNELVVEAFSENEHESINDGMDASLLMLDTQSNQLQWAGANNPLWIVSSVDEQINLAELKGNKQPIGKFDFTQAFTNHQLPLIKGNKYYLFSDGFADQFGGPDWEKGGKKFSQKKFRELICSIAKHPLSEQAQLVEQAFLNWKSDGEQIDDILVAGIAF